MVLLKPQSKTPLNSYTKDPVKDYEDFQNFEPTSPGPQPLAEI